MSLESVSVRVLAITPAVFN